jgi:3',5'-cyclic AMP phosphodiesterase CpdA
MMNRKMFVWMLPAVFLALTVSVLADSPGIHTDRQSAKILPLPKGDDVFHFIGFGDRTGGPAEGIKVLAQAVADANLLDPDLVMTVGDLVNGYNQTTEWTAQMEEFQATMNKLKMPWFPVAGNHDIYWRRSEKNPEAKPPREHEDNYEKHFGPLWYWFKHKQSGFLILFSDEGHPDGRVRSFSDRDQQRISGRQMQWMASALDEMKPLKHVFVFLHHPYWWSERYPANNWDDVHKLLVRNGNVRAVLAGHIHQMRYDGVRDGIAYYALATTGGSLTPGMEYQYFGLLHHFNVVTVRDSGFSMASVPVGGVFDPKQFTPARLADVEAARYVLHEFLSPPIAIKPDGSATATYQVAVTNPCTLPLDVTVLGRGDKSWIVAPDHRHAKVEPGQRRIFDFACVREPGETLDEFTAPDFELRFDVLTPDARLPMPNWSRPAHIRLLPPEQGWTLVKTNGCFVFDGKSGCLEIEKNYLTLPNGPFTVEAWVNPAEATAGAIVANMRIGGCALDVAEAPRFSVQTDPQPADARKVGIIKPAVSVQAKQKLPSGEWSHLAGVFDGAKITLFVNGRVAGSAPVAGARFNSDKSLFIGARPNPAWNVHNFSYPVGFWKGAVDEVRVSQGARYTADFVPKTKLDQDASTVVVLANDQHFGPFVPVSGRSEFQAKIKGAVTLAHGQP